MNCLLRCVGLTVAGGGINILQQKLRRRARRRRKPSSSTYSSVKRSWNVTSTLIYGKSEAILVDCQFLADLAYTA
jgi:hypothetical protein